MKERDFLLLAVKRLKKGIDANKHNVEAAIVSLRMVNGEDHWDQAELTKRKLRRRPALTVNRLASFVDQVNGDMRHMRPGIKIRPADANGDTNIAKIRQGIIDNVQRRSNAEMIYDQAGNMEIAGGWGAWRVLTKYTEENPFLQEMGLELIPNPFVIVWDPNAKDPAYADAQWCIVYDRMPKEDFDEMYPKAKSVGPDNFDTSGGMAYEHWFDDDSVTVAEYFVVEKVKKVVCLMKDGTVLDKDKAEAIVEAYNSVKMNAYMPDSSAGMTSEAPEVFPSFPSGVNDPDRPQILKEKEIEDRKIKRYVITCAEILEENDIPGKFIPIITIKGPELNIEGKSYVRSLVKHGLDPQKLMNYWLTSAAETVALAPKSPWIGTAKQFEGYEQDYAAANEENYPFLKYNPDPDTSTPPNRVASPNPPIAMFAQIDKAEENLKATIGMYGRDLGEAGMEASGVAIQRAQTPGDVATYQWIDNLSRGILQTGRIMNSMIPEIYDTERTIRITKEDDTDSFVPINTTTGNAFDMMQQAPDKYTGIDQNELKKIISTDGRGVRYNDIASGDYEAYVEIGPSYTTQRQEAAESMIKLAMAYPPLMGVAGDIVVKAMDFKDADALAERLQKTLPPGMVPPKPGDHPPQPPPPDPNLLIKQIELQIKEKELQLKEKDIQLKELDIKQEQAKLVIGMRGQGYNDRQ